MARESFARLRRRIAEAEGRRRTTDDGNGVPSSDTGPLSSVPFAVPRLDRVLAGGLRRGALHEIHCHESRDTAAATGFAAAVLARLAAEEARSANGATGKQEEEARRERQRPTGKQGEEARSAPRISPEASPRTGSGATGKQENISRPVLWIVEAAAANEAGLPYGAGLGRFGLDPARLIVVRVTKPGDALWVFEEGLRCRGLAAVLAEIRGSPRVLDLTASRRLALRARAHGVMGLLLRQSDRAEPGAATTRWLVTPRPAAITDDYPAGIGRPAWRLTLERNRLGTTGIFDVEWDHDRRIFTAAADAPAHPRPVAPLPVDRPPAPPDVRPLVA